MEPIHKQRWFMILIYGVLGLLFLYLLQVLHPMFFNLFVFVKRVITPFFVALIISYVLHPVVSLLNERKVPRTVAVLLIYAVFLTSLTVIAVNLTPVFMKQVKELNEHIPELSMRAQNLVTELNQSRYLPESIRDGIYRSLERMEQSISLAVSNYIDGIANKLDTLFIFLIIPFLAFYMLKDYRMLERAALSAVPQTHRKLTVKMFWDIDTALGNYIRGQLLVCLIVGVLAYIGYWVIKMPYPLLLASIVAIFNIIPYIGPYFGAAPALIMASTISWKMVIFVIIVNVSVQILEGNFISPQVVGKKLHLHPLAIIFALLLGENIAGIVGLILAVPMLAVSIVIYQHLKEYLIARRTTT